MKLSKLSTLAAAAAAVVTLTATPAHAGKTIDAIKADLAKAVAKATAHDHAGAIKDLAPLPARCSEAENLADDFAQWKVIDGPRKVLAMTYQGKASANATVTAQLRAMEATYNQSATDAAAKKYKDAVTKLDQIPDQFEKIKVKLASGWHQLKKAFAAVVVVGFPTTGWRKSTGLQIVFRSSCVKRGMVGIEQKSA